jgi:hypothetical protein
MRKQSRTAFWSIALIAIAMATVLFWAGSEHLVSNPSTIQLEPGVIAKLLKQALVDDKHWMDRGGASHITILTGQAIWDRRYPVTYAEQRLQSVGTPVIPVLLGILQDRTQSPEVRGMAAEALSVFDDVRILSAYAKVARDKMLDAATMRRAVAKYLPFDGSIYQYSRQELIQWLESATHKDYGEGCLELLDRLLRLRYEEGGLFPTTADYRIIRWLNFSGDTDLDKWLSEKAPAALEFRNRQHLRGYDPVASFERFCARLHVGSAGEGCDAVFSDPSERRACHDLIEVVWDSSSALYPPAEDGWLERLRAWYKQNRSELRYDFAKHRFVLPLPVQKLVPEQAATKTS